jgi:4-amino-4-deoxy-L-arabinose transferase-like glycosyltransferase
MHDMKKQILESFAVGACVGLGILALSLFGYFFVFSAIMVEPDVRIYVKTSLGFAVVCAGAAVWLTWPVRTRRRRKQGGAQQL